MNLDYPVELIYNTFKAESIVYGFLLFPIQG